MNVDDEYLVKVVVEELRHIQESWNDVISDSTLRRESSILRLLLVENKISQAWRILGYQKEPTVSTETLEDALKHATQTGTSLNSITYAQVGGAKCNGVIAGAVLCFDEALNDSEMQRQTHTREPMVSKLTISNYMRTPFLRAHLKQCSDPELNGIYAFNRVELVKYVANKLGGTHLDVRRNKTSVEERKHIVLDMLAREVRVLDKPAIYFEMLAIGQKLAVSEDVVLLLDRARRLGIA